MQGIPCTLATVIITITVTVSCLGDGREFFSCGIISLKTTAIPTGQADPQMMPFPASRHGRATFRQGEVLGARAEAPARAAGCVSADHTHYRDHTLPLPRGCQNKVEALSKALGDTHPSPMTPHWPQQLPPTLSPTPRPQQLPPPDPRLPGNSAPAS